LERFIHRVLGPVGLGCLRQASKLISRVYRWFRTEEMDRCASRLHGMQPFRSPARANLVSAAKPVHHEAEVLREGRDGFDLPLPQPLLVLTPIGENRTDPDAKQTDEGNHQ
jgi:hypothetical protein